MKSDFFSMFFLFKYIVVGYFNFSVKSDNDIFNVYYQAAYKTYHTSKTLEIICFNFRAFLNIN